jgi:hypothetical protein
MRDPLDLYLDQVMSHAALAPADARRVRCELTDHLQCIVAQRDMSQISETQHKEITAMLNDEFGNPAQVGKSIAAAKGRFHTYLKKQKRRLPVQLAVALLLAFSVRFAVAEEFYASSNAAAPQVPQGSRFFVYKLARHFSPGDVIVYRDAGESSAKLAIVRADDAADTVQIARAGAPDAPLSRSRIIGRVFLKTR